MVVMVLILLAGVVILGMKNYSLEKKLLEASSVQEKGMRSKSTSYFLKLFVDKVLDANGKEVDFETRLKLENEARRLGDADILEQWKKFTNSKTEADAQTQTKELLKLLVKKSIEE